MKPELTEIVVLGAIWARQASRVPDELPVPSPVWVKETQFKRVRCELYVVFVECGSSLG